MWAERVSVSAPRRYHGTPRGLLTEAFGDLGTARDVAAAVGGRQLRTSLDSLVRNTSVDHDGYLVPASPTLDAVAAILDA